MNELRLAGLALGLPVLGGPGQHAANRVRVARAVEEVVGRGLGLAAGAGRVGERRGIGCRNIGDLVLGQESRQRFGVGGAPAENGGDLVGARPFLVLGDRARHLIAVVDGIDVDLVAVDAAVLVDPRIGVRDTLSERRSDVRGRHPNSRRDAPARPGPGTIVAALANSRASEAVLSSVFIVMDIILRLLLEVFLLSVPFRPQCENG